MRTFFLMLGSALCGIVLFVAAVYGYFWYQLAQFGPGSVQFPPRSEKTVAVAPPFSESERFYGTFAMMAGKFPPEGRQTVLAAGDYENHKRLFEWRQRPVVAGTSANLAEQGAKLQKGYYYTVEIEALDGNKRKLSESPRTMQRADFRVVD